MTISNYKNYQIPDYDHNRYDIPIIDTLKKIIDSETTFMIPLVFDDGAGNSWTIVEGDNRKGGGYSQAEWDQAYNNKINIKAALDYGASLGYKVAMLPSGHYNVCYSNVAGDIITNIVHNDHDIVMPSNIQLNMFNDVTISVMFDSDETATSGSSIRNPYDNGSYDPNELRGNVFSFSKSYNSSIVGGTIIGEMPERSFVDPNELMREFNTGVFIRRGSANCYCHFLTTIGFSGDGHSGVSSHNPDLGSQLPDAEVRTFYPGQLSRVDGTVDTNVTTSYTTNLVSLSNLDLVNCKEIVMRTNLGTTRIPEFVNQKLILAWYDNTDTFIEAEDFEFLEITKIPINAAKIRMCCMDEADGNPSMYFTLRITPPVPENYRISNCTILECHRGGISNLVNRTVISNNKIYNNGLGWKEGYPEFNDPTRYGINCEDGLANHITIVDNDIKGSNHGILMSGINIFINNNTISNCTGVGVNLYYMKNATISENTFNKCNLAFGFVSYSRNRNIVMTDNIIDGCLFSDPSLVQSEYTLTIDGIQDNSPHAMYKPHADRIDDFRVSNLVYKETDIMDGSGRHEYIRGHYTDSVFNLTKDQVSTFYTYIMTAEGSNLTINCSDINRRIGNEGSIYGLTQNGGKQYRSLIASQSNTYNFYGDGATLNVDRFEFPQYGTPATSVHTLNFYNYTLKMNGGFTHLFNMDTNSTAGTTNLHMNFYNCKFVIEAGIGGTLFYIDYAGTDHNVDINLDHCVIDVSRTGENVYLGSRHASYVNNVQLTKTNTEIIGDLDQTATGFDILNNGGVQVGDDTALASIDKVGTFRYRTDGSNSYVEVCVQTGASTYSWDVLVQKTF